MIAIRMEEQAWMQFNTQAKEGVSLLSPLSTLLVNVVYHIRYDDDILIPSLDCPFIVVS